MERNEQDGQNGQYAGSSLGDIETIASKENRFVEHVEYLDNCDTWYSCSMRAM